MGEPKKRPKKAADEIDLSEFQKQSAMRDRHDEEKIKEQKLKARPGMAK